MPGQAQVTSIEAIESFRASLLIFLAKGRPALEEVFGEVVRVRSWLEIEQRGHWDREMRLRERKLEDARQELFSARLSTLDQPSAAQHLAVQRAQRAVQEAEAKQRLVKKWTLQMDHEIRPLLKQLEQLLSFMTAEMPEAAASLARAVGSLEAYTSVPTAAAPPSAASDSGHQNPAQSDGITGGREPL